MLQPARFGVFILLFALALQACGGGSAGGHYAPLQNRFDRRMASSTGVDWPTFGFNRQRWSYNPFETTLTPATVAGLTLKYSFQLRAKHTNTQPIVATNVKLLSGVHTTLVFVGDEGGNLYAIDDSTGTAAWSKTLGKGHSSCWSYTSNGVTSDPVIDRRSGRIYVLDGAGTLWAFDIWSGKRADGFPPLQAFTDPNINHTWSGLLLDWARNTLYYPTASHCDSGTYYGTINAVDTTTQQITTFNLVVDKSSYYANGVWSWGGESIDPDDRNLFAGVGNSKGSLGESGTYSDSVIELTKSLQFVADEQPDGNLQGDLDIGTTPVPFNDGSAKCLAFERKDGNFFSIDRTNLQNGQYVTELHLGGALAGAAYSPAQNALYVSVPRGVTKLAIGANCALSIAWQTASIHATGSSVPAVAGGVVYAAGDNIVYAVDAGTGAMLWNSGATIKGRVAAEPTIVNGRLYAASWDGHLYVFGL
ncbi:MAG TPA: PQQ-binding-like beta-propeller repeat protein [Candidatus Baltobacteraceae bacterium]|jgi:outer membrane protein assembly factor BamB|nr:PQQ-binding-like beta-propeller repeat protein [Candidatus Baltobacteraceae bacterium]